MEITDNDARGSKTGLKVAKRRYTSNIPRKQRATPQRSGRRCRMKDVKIRMRQVNQEMKLISEEQKSIREGQKEVRQKLEKLGDECNQLREDTDRITKQSVGTKLCLNLMLQFLQAKKDSNFAKATSLVLSLRQLLGKQNKEK